jgi:hypothetical protein
MCLYIYARAGCQRCTGACPAGTYIKPSVEACNGLTFGPGDSSAFNPTTDCLRCAGCDP